MGAAEPISHDDDARDLDTNRELDKVRLRLLDAAANLKPLPSMSDLEGRVSAVSDELEKIQNELLLLVHVHHAEASGLEGRLREIDRKLESGWRPTGRPVEDVVADLRERRRAAKG